MAHGGRGETSQPFLMESGRLHGMSRNVPKGTWNIGSGDGDRKWKTVIPFKNAYASPPTVVVAFSLLDLVCEADYRLNVEARKITNKDFKLVVSTTKDTVVWSTAVSWFAYDKAEALKQGISIQSGRTNFDCKAAGWTKKEGPRQVTQNVVFTNSFVGSNPHVITSLCQFDVAVNGDMILATAPAAITQNGFTCQLSTDHDAHVWSTSVAWIAVDHGFYTDTSLSGMVQVGAHPFQKSNPGYQLHIGSGARDLTSHEQFTKNFAVKPTVVAFLCGVNAKVEQEMDFRVSCEPSGSTASGFELKFGTWSNSQIKSGCASYLIHGTQHAVAKPVKATTTPAPVPAPQTTLKKSASSSPAGEPPAKKQKTEETVMKDEEDDDEEDTCKICFDAKINTCIDPCGHLATCFACSEFLMKDPAKKKCPICKVPINKMLKIFKT